MSLVTPHSVLHTRNLGYLHTNQYNGIQCVTVCVLCANHFNSAILIGFMLNTGISFEACEFQHYHHSSTFPNGFMPLVHRMETACKIEEVISEFISQTDLIVPGLQIEMENLWPFLTQTCQNSQQEGQEIPSSTSNLDPTTSSTIGNLLN